MKSKSKKLSIVIVACLFLSIPPLVLTLVTIIPKAPNFWILSLGRNSVDVSGTNNPNYFKLIKLSHYKDEDSVALFNPKSDSIEIYDANGGLQQSKRLEYAEDEAVSGMIYLSSKDGFLLLVVNYKNLERAFDNKLDMSNDPSDTFKFLFVKIDENDPVQISFDEESELGFISSLQFLDMKVLAGEMIQLGNSKHRLDLVKRYISFDGENYPFSITTKVNNDANTRSFLQLSSQKTYEVSRSEYGNRCTPMNISDFYLACIAKSTNRESLIKGADMYEFWTMNKAGRLGKYFDKVFDVDIWGDRGYILRLDGITNSWVIEKVLV